MLVPISDFLHLDRVTHLAGGGQTPFLVRAQAALERFAQAKGTGLAGQRANDAVHASVSEKVAALLGAEADDIGFPSSVAHGVSLVADGIDWREGDNVVMERWEFPSLMNPFLAQRRRGVEVRTVTPEPGTMRAPLARFDEAIDAKTRVVAVSHVSYLTGERHDLEAYAALAKKVGALFVVDASHALGSVPVHAPVADLLVGCCYKFLLGIHGAAIAYWNRARIPDWRTWQWRRALLFGGCAAIGPLLVAWSQYLFHSGRKLKPETKRHRTSSPLAWSKTTLASSVVTWPTPWAPSPVWTTTAC